MDSTPKPQRDIHYQCLMTSLAILLFLTGFYFHSALSQTAEMAHSMDSELPLLSNTLVNYPRLTILLLFGMMTLTIIFAWLKRLGSMGAAMAAVFLLLQGIALLVLNISAKLPWIRMIQSFSE
jgi:hypothetical protein